MSNFFTFLTVDHHLLQFENHWQFYNRYFFFLCRTGLYPLTGMENTKSKKENRPPLNLSRPKSPEDAQNNNQGNEEEVKELKESRLVSFLFIFSKFNFDTFFVVNRVSQVF